MRFDDLPPIAWLFILLSILSFIEGDGIRMGVAIVGIPALLFWLMFKAEEGSKIGAIILFLIFLLWVYLTGCFDGIIDWIDDFTSGWGKIV
tara:strand:- start:1435 stop:1707 length:273 start_codon:yes stop_codon:yes gene_type:complete